MCNKSIINQFNFIYLYLTVHDCFLVQVHEATGITMSAVFIMHDNYSYYMSYSSVTTSYCLNVILTVTFITLYKARAHDFIKLHDAL